jgi:predicted MPP superfamily phosphohydrolase
VVITGDLSAGTHRLAQYSELAEQIRKPIYFVLGNHDRYGTTFANTEAVVTRLTRLFSHMVRLDGSQVIPLTESVALIGVDGWADGLGGEGPTTKARINDFYQILDFATDTDLQVFRAMKERARKYAQALKPSLLKALSQYQTTIIATHVPPFEGAAWHEGAPSSADFQPFFSSPIMGNLIKTAAAKHPEKSVLVLCGHTHSPGVHRDGNILVLTAGTRYGFPEISDTIDLDRLGSLFE